MNQEAFDRLWHQQQEFQFATPSADEERCIYAQHFADWADALYQER